MDTKQLLEAAQTLNILRTLFVTPANEWLPVVAAVAGALVGGLVAVVPQLIIEWRKSVAERKSVTTALLAEVSAIVGIIKARDYIQGVKEFKNILEGSPDRKLCFQIMIPDHYARIYDAHINKIGVLPSKLASEIIEFHQLIDAVVQDVKPGGSIASIGGTVEDFSKMLKIVNQALNLGERLMSRG